MPRVAWSRFRVEVLALYEPPARAKATWFAVRKVLDLLESLGVRSPAELTPQVVSRFAAVQPDLAAATIKGRLSYLRPVCDYAVWKGYLERSPFEFRSRWLRVDGPREDRPDHRDRHHPAESIARALRLADAEAAGGSWLSGRLQALVYTYAFTGMRCKEPLGMLVADVDLGSRLLRIRSNRARPLKTSGSGQPMAIAEDLADVLGRWIPRTGCDWLFPGIRLGGPWLYGGPGFRPLDQVKALGVRAGVDGLTIQSFRHTLSTLSEGWGLGELELQRWLRHRRPRTQDHYRRTADRASLLATASKINYG